MLERIDEDEDLIDCSAGVRHSVVLSEVGHAYSFGWDGHGQLGTLRGGIRGGVQGHPEATEACSDDDHHHEHNASGCEPRRVPGEWAGVACGHWHTLFLSKG